MSGRRRRTRRTWRGRSSSRAAASTRTDPNPRVGCVLATATRVIVGEGWHERAGEPHAEVVALAAAGERGARRDRLRHARALLASRAHAALRGCAASRPACARVVYAHAAIRIRGSTARGIARLAAAGIAVEGGVLEPESRELNRGFHLAHDARPAVGDASSSRASLDGRTALAERREPLDHRRGRARGRAAPARAHLGGADGQRHRARRRPAPRRAPAGRARASRCASCSTRGCARRATRAHPRRRRARRWSSARMRTRSARARFAPPAPRSSGIAVRGRQRRPAAVLALLADRQVQRSAGRGGPGSRAPSSRRGSWTSFVLYIAPMLLGRGCATARGSRGARARWRSDSNSRSSSGRMSARTCCCGCGRRR